VLRAGLKCVLLLIFLFVSLATVPGKRFVFADSHLNGDWIVSGTESYYGEVFVLNGNLIVEDGGNLTFRKVTLKMNCSYNGQYNITVKHGGEFYVLEGSVITSSNSDKRIGEFIVAGTFRMNNSELHECGWTDAEGAWGLVIVSDDAIVENSLISNNFRVNIGSDGVIFRNNNITENDHHGMFVWDSSPIICDNHISLNRVSGIEGGDCSPTVRNNTITSNGAGIVFSYEANPIIQDNIITLNNGEGIIGADNCSLIIQGNNVTSNGGYGGIVIKLNCTGIIQGNMIMNNSMDGIHSGDYSNLLIQGNIITSNGEDGVRCNENVQAEIHWNDIYGNRVRDVSTHNHFEYDPSVSVNATYNYWGDGPDSEKISQNVLYNPWLTESIFSAEITNPLSGETVSASVTVSTEVHAQNVFHKIEFYMDNKLEYTAHDMPYEWNLDTTQCTETEHKIAAKAYDLFGLKISTSITVFIDNTAPTVSIREPEPENIYCGIVRASVNATDIMEIGNVHVKVDNTEWLVMTYDPADLLWKYDFNTTLLSDGEHTLMTLALDKARNPATTSTVFLTDNTPPILTIQTPQSGITVGLTLIVDVQASDSTGTSRIEFYLQDVLVYTVTDTPYQWS